MGVALSESSEPSASQCGQEEPSLAVRGTDLDTFVHHICSRRWGRAMSLGYLMGNRNDLNYKVRKIRVRSSWPSLASDLVKEFLQSGKVGK